ncbi:MAG: putative lipid II flippase FtsW [candidate division Zixibacteria bacterium]|nr:putative lipid II flippase FtsW [candidate division Zixibacteria bacterium]
MERHRIDLPLLIVTLVLVGIGSIMVYSASYALAEERFHGDSGFFIKRHLGRVAIGLAILAIFTFIDYRKLRTWAIPIIGLGLFLLVLVFVPGLGLSIRGATRTLKLGILNFQPAEFMKIGLILFLAHYLDRRQQIIRQFVPGLLPALALIGVVFLLIAEQPDFGTAIALSASAGMLLFVGKAKLKHLLSIAAVGIPVVAFKLITSDHSRKRLITYIDRLFGDPDRLSNIRQDSDYQVYQSLISLGNGGFFGTGLGEGRQKYHFLPDPHTDFIFAIVGEEFGFIGGIVLIGLFAVFVWRGIAIARQAPDGFGFFLASGLSLLIGVHVMINLGVATGLLPTTGIPLPFISYGGTWTLFCLMAVGILLNISKNASRWQRLRYD